jgi:hypothetical protein
MLSVGVPETDKRVLLEAVAFAPSVVPRDVIAGLPVMFASRFRATAAAH